MSSKEFELKVFQSLAFPVRVGTGMKQPATLKANAHHANMATNLCKVTLIITGSNSGLVDALKAIRELKSKNCYLTLVFSKGALKVLDTVYISDSLSPDRIINDDDDREGIKNLVENTDICIAPNLTQNTLTKTALGIQDEISSILLWQYLLNGITTVIGTDSVLHGWFDADLNSAMKRVLEGYIKTLVSFGAKVDDSYDYVKYVGDEEKSISVNKPIEKLSLAASRPLSCRGSSVKKGKSIKASDVNINVKLITADYVNSVGTGEIVVSKGQLITPLAVDAAKELGITIVKS